MHNETLSDAVEWVSAFHKHLSDCLTQASAQAGSERSELLLDYLAAHEAKLTRLMKAYEQQGDVHALNTWCTEYLNKNNIAPDQLLNQSLAGASPDEIIGFVVAEHRQVIDLYKELQSRAPIGSMQELLDELVALEEHELMVMAQGANRLTDI